MNIDEFQSFRKDESKSKLELFLELSNDNSISFMSLSISYFAKKSFLTSGYLFIIWYVTYFNYSLFMSHYSKIHPWFKINSQLITAIMVHQLADSYLEDILWAALHTIWLIWYESYRMTHTHISPVPGLSTTPDPVDCGLVGGLVSLRRNY